MTIGKRMICSGMMLAIALGGGVCVGQSVDLSGVAHVAFRVSDVRTTSLFYQKLGFVQAFAFDNDGKVSEAFLKINDRQFLELYPLTAKEPAIGFMHLCFEGLDLNALAAAYRARGLHPTEVKKAHAGNLLFTTVGPEQQNIEYTEYLPGSMHWNDRGKDLGADRISEHLLAVDVAMQDPRAAELFYVEKLSFRPVGGDAHELLLPGSSGEAVGFTSSEDKRAPVIVLEVRDLRRTAKTLRKDGFAVRVEREGVFVSDPDGIVIEFARAGRPHS